LLMSLGQECLSDYSFTYAASCVAILSASVPFSASGWDQLSVPMQDVPSDWRPR
jgi:hypothetical protein